MHPLYMYIERSLFELESSNNLISELSTVTQIDLYSNSSLIQLESSLFESESLLIN